MQRKASSLPKATVRNARPVSRFSIPREKIDAVRSGYDDMSSSRNLVRVRSLHFGFFADVCDHRYCRRASFISKEFNLTPTEEGFAASLILLGALCGSICTGYLADRFGRRAVLLLSAGIFIAANLPILFISSFPMFLLLRFATGIAAGITSLSCPPLSR